MEMALWHWSSNIIGMHHRTAFHPCDLSCFAPDSQVFPKILLRSVSFLRIQTRENGKSHCLTQRGTLKIAEQFIRSTQTPCPQYHIPPLTQYLTPLIIHPVLHSSTSISLHPSFLPYSRLTLSTRLHQQPLHTLHLVHDKLQQVGDLGIAAKEV